jgi:hypothetical protein
MVFLESLFCDSDPQHYLEITILDDKFKDAPYVYEGGTKRSPATAWVQLGKMKEKLPRVFERAQVQNDDGMGIYFGACARHETRPKGKRALKTSVSTAPALWVDLDYGHDKIGQATETLRRFTHPPTYIVATGGGVQGWWVLRSPLKIVNEAVRKAFEQTLRGLAKALRGDTSVADVARIMRLPGFRNMKPDRGGYMASIVVDDGPVYDFASFVGYAALDNPPKRYVPKRTTKPRNGKRPRLTNRAEGFLQAGAAQGTRHSTLLHTAYQMQAKGFSKNECWDEAGQMAMSCGLPLKEVSGIINHVYEGKQ